MTNISFFKYFTTLAAAVLFCMLVLVFSVFWGMVLANDAAKSAESSHRIHMLVEELLHSSEELTRIARTFVVTGDPKWEDQYRDILAIRNGEKPRSGGQRIPLASLVQTAGIKPDDLALLEESQRNSDALARMEVAAMNAFKGKFDDGAGHFTVEGKPDPVRARDLLYSDDYHEMKAKILAPGEDFLQHLELQSQATEISSIGNLLGWLYVVVGLLIAGLLILLARLFSSYRHLTQQSNAKEAAISANFRSFYNLSTDFLFVLDEHCKILVVNETLHRRLGWSDKELLGKSIAVLHRREDHSLAVPAVRSMLAGDPAPSSLPLVAKDGTCVPVETSVVHGVWNGLPAIYGASRDLSEAAFSKEKFSKAFDASPALMAISTIEDGRFVDVNISCLKILGFTREEAIGKTVHELGILKDLDLHDIFLRAVDQGQATSLPEIDFFDKAGNTHQGEFSWEIIEIGGRKHILSVVNDTTDRKRADEALRGSENHLRTILENNPECITIIDAEGRLLQMNSSGLALTEATSIEEIAGTLVHELVAPEFREAFADLHRRVIAGERMKMEFEIVGLKGRHRWVETHAVPMQEKDHAVHLAVTHDITNRKSAEAERERLTMAIEQAAEAVLITDAAGQIQYVNPAFESLTGYSKEEAMGRNPNILKSGEHDAAFYRNMWQTLRSGKIWHGRVVNKKKDGTLFSEDSTISPITDDGGRIVNYVAVKRDITQELSLQSQLNQAQKMESVGRLAGGVAHDFNNMLCVILGHTELALEQVDAAHPLFDDLQEIHSAASRSAGLTRQLLAFARKQTVTPQLLDLNETLAGMFKMLGRLTGEAIQLAIRPGKELWQVMVDPSQIDQILVNLCVNARDAIANVGTITFETGNCRLDEEFCATHDGAVPGEYVRLTVGDTGSGMDKETQAHIFEPFFTTKAIGEGTGLGLATVYGIVKQNHGFLNACSELGKGTTFAIYLPRHVGQAAVPKADVQPNVRGSETILLVEDEPAIRTMTRMMLVRQGYTVLAADSPEEAIRLTELHSDKINLLMTDVVMPEMNGMDLAKSLQARCPGLKCLFMSGYTSNVLSPHGVLETGVNFIQKPFSMVDLSTKIRSVLNPG